jgi:hypothetical protein
MPLEGDLYQWAKLGFNEFAGFMIAWNLWLLSITVIALGGMFVTTNLSYAIGDSAAWMPHSKWCVSLISSALVGGLVLTAVRGIALGKWVHNIDEFACLAYGALIVLPFFSLARGIEEYHPFHVAAPRVDLLLPEYFHQARGGRSAGWAVAILAGEARAKHRSSVMIAAPSSR